MSIALAFVTAERPCSAQTLVRSARRILGDIGIYVVDQSIEINGMSAFYQANGVNVRRLSSEIGLAAARNALLREITEDFVILCEDNVFLGACNAFDDAMTVLEEQPYIGVLVGQLHEIDAGERAFIGEQFQLNPGQHTRTDILISFFSPSAQSVAGIDVSACDSAARFCILRRSVFLEGNQWNERIRSCGVDADFFLNLKRNAKWRVVHLPSLGVLKLGSGQECADDWADFMDQGGPAADKVGQVEDAADGDDESARQVPEELSTPVERCGRTASQVDRASPEFELHSLSRRSASALVTRRMKETSLRLLLEESADVLLYDARASVMRCCYSPHRSGDELLVWCRPQLRGRSRGRKRSWFTAAEKSGQAPATLHFRWFDSFDQPLVWESESLQVELHGAYWSPIATRIPLWPAGTPHLRFEVVIESDEDRIPVAIGFLFNEALGEKCVRTEKALALSLPSPNALSDPGPGRTVVGVLGDPETPSRLIHSSHGEHDSMLKIDLAQPGVFDLRALLLVDWPGTGRRLTAIDTSQAGFQLTSSVVIPSSNAEGFSALGLLKSGEYCRLELPRSCH